MGDRIGTHSPNCWAFSHLHYDCAIRHIAELEAKLANAVGALEEARPFVADDTEATVDIADRIDAVIASIKEGRG